MREGMLSIDGTQLLPTAGMPAQPGKSQRSYECLCPMPWVRHSMAQHGLGLLPQRILLMWTALCVSLRPLPQDTSKQCESSRRGCQQQPG